MTEKLMVDVRIVRDRLVNLAAFRAAQPGLEEGVPELIRGALAAQELLETLSVTHTEPSDES